MKGGNLIGGYQLLDSGRESKLERVGPYLLVRPSPQAVWSPSLPEKEWQAADAVYIRSSTGGGNWDFHRRLPEKWEIEYRGLKFFIKPTGFGHLGLFPEHGESWDWVEERIRECKGPISVLNMFAYTGGATMAAARAEATVCHLDASKGVVDWAREDAALSGLDDRPIRWIVDDVAKFVQKEIRRGKTYDAIILDPPSFGRGAKGEIWKIEDDLIRLLAECKQVLSDKPLFVLLSCHSPGFTPLVLQNLLAEMMNDKSGALSCGEMVIPEISGRLLPSGAYARWSSE
ncbi:MAG TPA: class I SAM-dependent methyltransferase [Thermodesulfobacteriota bacterium]|nr:class I SAM-dependent methyltransferase [Thermodesulfobacteriota bacterium]